MPTKQPFNIVTNLGPGFYRARYLKDIFDRLGRLGHLRKISDARLFPSALARANAWIGWGSPEPTAEMLAGAPHLEWSGHLNLTRDGALALLRHGVVVSEARRCYSQSVAEFALALILAGLRKTSAYHCAMREAKEVWPFQGFPARIDPLQRELTGRPVGLVGFGGIGRRLAEFLKPFRVPLFVSDPFMPKKVVKEHGGKPVELMELIRSSDVVVLCAANTFEARHLMGKKEINALRKNAVLVNIGRSWLVDTAALVNRLKKGDLIAMLDVFDKEPLQKTSPLRKLPNAYLTPHRAGGIVGAMRRGLTMLADDLEAYRKGRPPAHALDEKTARIACASTHKAPN